MSSNPMQGQPEPPFFNEHHALVLGGPRAGDIVEIHGNDLMSAWWPSRVVNLDTGRDEVTRTPLFYYRLSRAYVRFVEEVVPGVEILLEHGMVWLYRDIEDTTDRLGVTRLDVDRLKAWPGPPDPSKWEGFDLLRYTNMLRRQADIDRAVKDRARQFEQRVEQMDNDMHDRIAETLGMDRTEVDRLLGKVNGEERP